MEGSAGSGDVIDDTLKLRERGCNPLLSLLSLCVVVELLLEGKGSLSRAVAGGEFSGRGSSEL